MGDAVHNKAIVFSLPKQGTPWGLCYLARQPSPGKPQGSFPVLRARSMPPQRGKGWGPGGLRSLRCHSLLSE